MFGSKILVLIPHPDDEVVAAAATIGRAKAQGAEFLALYLTDGCLSRGTMWPWRRRGHAQAVARRRAEAERAAALLGLEPVGWAARSARSLWRELAAVHAEIQAAIAAHKPDQLWVPAYEGGNPDHDGLNALGQFFTQQLSVLEFAEYNFFDGKTGAQTFPHPNGAETIIELTDAERARKRALLKVYASEQNNLFFVGVEHECFRPLSAYDYSQPPHSGTLWYARHQWVPFRHPRVDFTPPTELRETICAYLKTASRLS